jgi:peroxiredoxin
MKISLHSRPGCPAAQRVRARLLELSGRYGFELVEAVAEAGSREAEALPRIEIDGRASLAGEPDREALEAAIRGAGGRPGGARPARRRSRAPVVVGALVFGVLVASKAWDIFVEPHRQVLLHLGVEPLGRPAPDFRLVDRQGQVVRLQDLRGKTVLLNFWATWCDSCRVEMPSMAQLAKELHGDDFVLIAASVDEGWEPIERFFGDAELPFVVLLDEQGAAAQAFGTHKFPESYVIDPQGTLTAKFTGPRDWSDEGFFYFFRDLLGRTGPRGATRRQAGLR